MFKPYSLTFQPCSLSGVKRENTGILVICLGSSVRSCYSPIRRELGALIYFCNHSFKFDNRNGGHSKHRRTSLRYWITRLIMALCRRSFMDKICQMQMQVLEGAKSFSYDSKTKEVCYLEDSLRNLPLSSPSPDRTKNPKPPTSPPR